jgi:hypothetical protein
MSISHVKLITPMGGMIPARNFYVRTGGSICCCGEKDNIEKTLDMRGRPSFSDDQSIFGLDT